MTRLPSTTPAARARVTNSAVRAAERLRAGFLGVGSAVERGLRRDGAPAGTAPRNELAFTEGIIRETRECTVAASPETAFRVIKQLGGTHDWPYERLWRLRGVVDLLLGGIGFRQGRRSDTDLRVGDTIDFWRVEVLDAADRRLRLRAEMKMPGRAWLQFDVSPANEDGTTARIVQTNFFEPRGLTGTLYWYALNVPHRFIF